MKISEVKEILGAEVLCGDHLMNTEVYSACGADLMSDVLAFVKEQSVLLTGLLNPQVVRTADMMDMHCIVFVRGKNPDQPIIELAVKKEIVLLRTSLRMYSACGKLYTAGLVGSGCD